MNDGGGGAVGHQDGVHEMKVCKVKGENGFAAIGADDGVHIDTWGGGEGILEKGKVALVRAADAALAVDLMRVDLFLLARLQHAPPRQVAVACAQEACADPSVKRLFANGKLVGMIDGNDVDGLAFANEGGDEAVEGEQFDFGGVHALTCTDEGLVILPLRRARVVDHLAQRTIPPLFAAVANVRRLAQAWAKLLLEVRANRVATRATRALACAIGPVGAALEARASVTMDTAIGDAPDSAHKALLRPLEHLTLNRCPTAPQGFRNGLQA